MNQVTCARSRRHQLRLHASAVVADRDVEARTVDCHADACVAGLRVALDVGHRFLDAADVEPSASLKLRRSNMTSDIRAFIVKARFPKLARTAMSASAARSAS
jgi:hypothetical protein